MVAETLLRENLSALLAVHGEHHHMTLATLNNLGLTLQKQDKLDEAADMFQTAYYGFCRTFGDKHPQTMRQMNAVAEAWQAQGKVSEAASLMQHALVQLQSARPDSSDPDHDFVLLTTAIVGNNLGNLLLKHGNLNQAKAYIEQAHEMVLKLRGERHPETFTIMMSVALLRHEEGRHAEALDVYREVCAGREVCLGVDHPDTCTVRNNLATLYVDCGQTEEAVALLRDVLDIRVRTSCLGAPRRCTRSGAHCVCNKTSFDRLAPPDSVISIHCLFCKVVCSTPCSCHYV